MFASIAVYSSLNVVPSQLASDCNSSAIGFNYVRSWSFWGAGMLSSFTGCDGVTGATEAFGEAC